MFSATQLSTVAHPRKAFTPSQIAVMRDLDRHGRAFKARNGWRLGGMFRKAATMQPLIAGGIAAEHFKDGKHTLQLTYAGRAAVAMLDV